MLQLANHIVVMSLPCKVGIESKKQKDKKGFVYLKLLSGTNDQHFKCFICSFIQHNDVILVRFTLFVLVRL